MFKKAGTLGILGICNVRKQAGKKYCNFFFYVFAQQNTYFFVTLLKGQPSAS